MNFNKIRIGIGVVCITVIIVMTILIVINHEKWFMSTVNIKYPDGCIEVFKNSKLVTDKCIEGRKLIEEQQFPIKRNNEGFVPIILPVVS